MNRKKRRIRILNSGDRGILLEFGKGISPKINQRIRSFFSLMQKDKIPGIIEVLPGYRSLLICYDPLLVEIRSLMKEIRQMEERIEEKPYEKGRKITIPVVYGEEFGPDLEGVAKIHGMEKEEVIELHQRPDYLLYMFGFAPGFPLLGGLPRKIVTPRLKTPRLRVPAGTVGIGNAQTGVYTIESPGGWQLIGRTPLKLYDPTQDETVILSIGDIVKFKRIDEEQYRLISQRVESQQEGLKNYIEG